MEQGDATEHAVPFPSTLAYASTEARAACEAKERRSNGMKMRRTWGLSFINHCNNE
jgi:hypothetical protein